MKKITHIPNRPFKTWSEDEQATWTLLASRQLKQARDKVSKRFFDGFSQLELTTDHLPDFQQVAMRLEKLIGWKLVSTNLDFADGQTWFELLTRKEFIVTEYIRDKGSLDYTPKPDMFHDLFGHLPYLMDDQLRRIILRFAELMLTASLEDRKKLGHIWWYTIEFGLVKEAREIKAFGAGLTSSFGELQKVFANLDQVLPFDPKQISQTAESPTKFHDKYFVLESFDQLEEFILNWNK